MPDLYANDPAANAAASDGASCIAHASMLGGCARRLLWTPRKHLSAVRDKKEKTHVRSQLESTVWEFWQVLPLASRTGFRGIRWVNRQVWPIRHGDAVPGRITHADVEVCGNSRKDFIVILEYDYAAKSPANR
jgi:hypothetical protein